MSVSKHTFEVNITRVKGTTKQEHGTYLWGQDKKGLADVIKEKFAYGELVVGPPHALRTQVIKDGMV